MEELLNKVLKKSMQWMSLIQSFPQCGSSCSFCGNVKHIYGLFLLEGSKGGWENGKMISSRKRNNRGSSRRFKIGSEAISGGFEGFKEVSRVFKDFQEFSGIVIGSVLGAF